MAGRLKVKFRKIALWFASILLLLAGIFCLSVLGAGLWLRTDGGQDFVKHQIATALEQTPYRLTYGRATLHSGIWLEIDHLEVSDRLGPFLILDKARLDISLAALVARRSLTASLTASSLALIRTPEEPANAKTPEKHKKPFDPTSLWIREIAITRLSVDRIDIGEAEGGKLRSFNPDFSIKIALQPDALPVEISGTVRPTEVSGDIAPFIPVEIAIKGDVTPAFDQFRLEHLSVRHDHYAIEGHGAFGFDEKGECNGALAVRVDSFKALFATQDGSLQFDAACNGAMMRPHVEANGKVAFVDLKDVAPILLNAAVNPSTDGVDGKIAVTGAYRKQPYALTVPFQLAGQRLTVTEMNGTLPETRISGNLVYATDSGLADGFVQIAIASLKPYGDMLAKDMAGRVMLEVKARADTVQALTADIKANAVRLDSTSIASASLAVRAADVKSTPFETATLDVNGVSISGLQISKLTLDIANQQQQNFAYRIGLAGKHGQRPVAVNGKGVVQLTPDWKFDRFEASPITASVNRHDMVLRGSLGPQLTDLTLAFDNFPAGSLATQPVENLNNLRLSGKLTATGASAEPKINLKLDARQVGGDRRLASLAVTALATYEKERADLSLKGTGNGIRALSGNASVPLRLSLWPFALDFKNSSPLKGAILADLDIQRLARPFMPPAIRVDGDAKASIAIGGTVAKPAFNGTFGLNNGQFTHAEAGVRLRAIQLEALLARQRIDIRRFAARDIRNGTMNGDGWVVLGGDHLQADIALTANNFNIVHNDMADATASADLRLRPAPDGFQLGGRIDVTEATITIPERFNSSIPKLNVVTQEELAKQQSAPIGPVIHLAIDARADNRVFVRGWGLDAEFGGRIRVANTASSPELYGKFGALRGRYEEFGKRFAIEKADMNFNGTVPPSPLMDVTVSTPANDVTAKINISGQATDPKVGFSSDPALPEDEVLSRILFDQEVSSISPLQAIQLANTLRRFSGKGSSGGLDPIGTIRKFTGVDDLQVETGEEGAVTVGAGKYITDRVYVEAEQGNRENSGAVNVQVELTPRISLESKVGQEQSGAGLLWKRDY